MTKSTWAAVDAYFDDHLLADDPVLEATLEANKHAALPAIDVSPSQGKLLYLLARLRSAKHILEIGTLGGYSTIWLARALPPDGKVVTLELEPQHAVVAQANIDRAGLSNKVVIHVGPAIASLETLHASSQGSFDLVFIDADKENIPAYFAWSLRLSDTGSVIIVDNVVREGAVIEDESEDERVQGVRQFVYGLSQQPGVEATVVQTVGSKGYDGFIIVYVKEAVA